MPLCQDVGKGVDQALEVLRIAAAEPDVGHEGRRGPERSLDAVLAPVRPALRAEGVAALIGDDLPPAFPVAMADGAHLGLASSAEPTQEGLAGPPHHTALGSI